MAVKELPKERREFIGLSTDTKPTVDVPDGSTFFEMDGEQKSWVYSSTHINPVTDNGWWEV